MSNNFLQNFIEKDLTSAERLKVFAYTMYLLKVINLNELNNISDNLPDYYTYDDRWDDYSDFFEPYYRDDISNRYETDEQTDRDRKLNKRRKKDFENKIY